MILFSAGQTLATAQRIYDDLKRAQENLVMATELHLIYLITPYNMAENIKPDRQAFFKAVSLFKPRHYCHIRTRAL